MSGTPSVPVVPEVPGWWIELQSAILTQMPRPGEIDLETAKGWLGDQGALKAALKEKLLAPMVLKGEMVNKFRLLLDLGVVRVRKDYQHEYAIKRFTASGIGGPRVVYPSVTDANYPRPARVMQPGNLFRVRLFQQNSGGLTTFDQRMVFLKSQNAVLVGVQGLLLVHELESDMLPRRGRLFSFDAMDRLWKHGDGGYRLPCLRDLDGVWHLDSFDITYSQGRDDIIVCFTPA